MYLELALYIMSLPIEQQICINSIVFIVAVILFIVNDKIEKREASFNATLTASRKKQKMSADIDVIFYLQIFFISL